MYNMFITMLNLLNQEINLAPIEAFCGGCSKRPEGVCTVYAQPTKLMWFRNHQQCAFNFKSATKEKKVVNALKASKRAAKGQA